jgi:hypothetical protein
MLGLAYLFLSAITCGLYFAWIALLVWVFRRTPSSLFVRTPALLFGVVLAALPISSALVRPLMETACNTSGRVVQLSNSAVSARAVVASGRHYGDISVVDLLATREIESVHLMRTAEYGDARRVATTAGIHDGREFSLRASNPNDPACAPYYKMLAQAGSSAVAYTDVCPAFGYEPIPETHLKVSELHRRERSWRTAFYAIEWEGVRLEQVSKGETTPLLEVREFKHPGFRFPLLLGVTPIGDFACRADKNTLSAVASVTPANTTHRERATFSKGQLADQLHSLEERFWGFRFPNELHIYEIWVFDHANHAKGSKSLDIQVDVQRHDHPVLLELTSNAKANWTVTGNSSDQMILVQTGASHEHQQVVGVPHTQVWSLDAEQPSAPPLLKFYLGRMLATKGHNIQAGRHCKVIHRAKDVTTKFSVHRCPTVAQ